MFQMRGLGLSIKTMLLATATIALAIAGMVEASLWWASICLSFLFAMLMYSLLAAVCRRGSARTFWLGFAIVGWAYTALMYAPGFDQLTGHRLITTKLLAKARPLFGKIEIPAYFSGPLADHVALSPDTAFNALYEDQFSTPGGKTAAYRPPQWDFFQQAGHMLFAIWFAGVGGILARRMVLDRSAGSGAAAV
jgi:hypothetical protein